MALASRQEAAVSAGRVGRPCVRPLRAGPLKEEITGDSFPIELFGAPTAATPGAATSGGNVQVES